MRQRIRSLARLANTLTLARRIAETRRNELEDEVRILSQRENALILGIAASDTSSPALYAAYSAALVKEELRRRELETAIERMGVEILSSARSAKGAGVKADRLAAEIDDIEDRKRLEDAAIAFSLRKASRKPD